MSFKAAVKRALVDLDVFEARAEALAEKLHTFDVGLEDVQYLGERNVYEITAVRHFRREEASYFQRGPVRTWNSLVSGTCPVRPAQRTVRSSEVRTVMIQATSFSITS